jgi:hypothetical protein
MENENLKIYNAVRECPKEALKPISAGRLKGKSDINPMWRIKKLTELYGPAGIGWYYEIVKQWLETGANNEISAFCNINLYIKSQRRMEQAYTGHRRKLICCQAEQRSVCIGRVLLRWHSPMQ